MKSTTHTIVLAVGLLLLGFTAAHACIGCGASQAEREAAAEASYGAEQLACIDKATTLAESKDCRARVRARWGVVEMAKDGGDQ